MQWICKTNYGHIGNIFFIFAQMYFSVIISTFSLKEGTQIHILRRFISFIKYLNNITHVWVSNNLSRLAVHYNIPVYKVTSRCFAVLKLKIGNKYKIYN